MPRFSEAISKIQVTPSSEISQLVLIGASRNHIGCSIKIKPIKIKIKGKVKMTK